MTIRDKLQAMPETSAISNQLLTIAEAVHELQAGRMVILCDDEERENEADICIAAQFATPEAVNFIAHHACGLICVAMTGERLDALHIPLAASNGSALQGTAFTASVDATHHTTTGISASDRAATIQALINPLSRPSDLAYPGHVFPLRARYRGTLERRGHTEASVDLMRIAGLEPAAVICEILGEDGEPARGAELRAMARKWHLGMLTVETIAQFRSKHTVNRISEVSLPTPYATFNLLHYKDITTGHDYMILRLGSQQSGTPALVRLHSACATGDLFGSQRCDCQAQLHASLRLIAQEGNGLLLYLPQEGRGIGLAGKLQAYRLQEQGDNTLEANEHLGYPVDARTYDQASEILQDLGITSVRLLTNNPAKCQALSTHGIQVKRVALEITPNEHNKHYLHVKQDYFQRFIASLPEENIPLH